MPYLPLHYKQLHIEISKQLIQYHLSHFTVFSPDTNLLNKLHESFKVLVIGAGGLGCEILKDLALSGVGLIHVIGN